MIYVLLFYVLLVALFPKRIKDLHTGEPYLTRYFLLRSPWLNVYLHHIHMADKDRHMHNHPMKWSRSYILSGGYLEERIPRHGTNADRDLEIYRPWYDVLEGLPGKYINDLTTAAYHRITFVVPNTWTLFVSGPYVSSWGFLVNGVHIDSELYLEAVEKGWDLNVVAKVLQ